MRPSVVAIALASSCFLHAGKASAQSCHEESISPPTPARLGLRASVKAEATSYRNARFEGEYQGLAVGAEWETRWVRLRGALPTYRLTRNGIAALGLGDVFAEIRVAFARTYDESLVGGFALAAALPTGNATLGLGMGHVMLMPNFWLAWHSERAFISAQLGYGRAITTEPSNHHAGGPAPIVNPMNASEVELSLNGALAVSSQLRARLGIHGGIPIAETTGVSRAVGIIAADLTIDRWPELGMEFHLPLAGNPFLARAVVRAAMRF